MNDVITDYQKWKQQGENLRVQAKHAMETQFRELLTEAVQIEHRVRYQLPWPVVGDVSAAIRLAKLHAHLPQEMIRSQQVFALAVASKRNHVRVLAQQEHVLHGIGLPRSHERSLERTSLCVGYEPQIND